MNVVVEPDVAPKSDAIEIPPNYESLAERFRPIFEAIAAGAVEREIKRELPYQEIEALREAGFGRVRIPQAHGGFGATIPQFFRLLVELATADSNVAHAFRGHFAFLEERINKLDERALDFWFPHVVAGKIIGYAMAERTNETGNSTLLSRDGENWRLNGVKYYSTGTIYADWIVVAAKDGEDHVSVAVPGNAEGVERIDDWDGFGQRLTGSGTTKFNNVLLEPWQLIRRFTIEEHKDIPEEQRGDVAQKSETGEAAAEQKKEGEDEKELGFREDSYGLSFLQMVLLSAITGAGRAALRDVIAFVQPRTRAFGVRGQSSPKDDPLVQRVVGRVASLAFAAESLVENNARLLEELYQARLAGKAKPEDFVQANIRTFQAQQVVIDLVLQATGLLFEVGGASATSEARRLDRHWRNARTAASHNPAIFRERAIGDYLLNGKAPRRGWRLRPQEDEKTAQEQGPQKTDEAPVAKEPALS